LNDGRTYATLSINGERYNLWDKNYLNNLKEGDKVDYDFKQSGKYKNIKNISKVNSNPKTNTTYNGLDNNGIDPSFKKDLEIVRMSCLKSAIYATRESDGLDLDERADTVIDVARKFENYVTDFEEFFPLEEEDCGNSGKSSKIH